MSVKIIVFLNLVIVVINFYLIWKLTQLRNYLLNFNETLLELNDNLLLILKEIPLVILLTGLEIKKFRSDYVNLKTKIKNIQKIIVITKLIYKIVRPKLT
jgi:hypothetical protein